MNSNSRIVLATVKLPSRYSSGPLQTPDECFQRVAAWRIDGLSENFELTNPADTNSALYLTSRLIDEILSGNVAFVSGPKGWGKSAVVKFLSDNPKHFGFARAPEVINRGIHDTLRHLIPQDRLHQLRIEEAFTYLLLVRSVQGLAKRKLTIIKATLAELIRDLLPNELRNSAGSDDEFSLNWFLRDGNGTFRNKAKALMESELQAILKKGGSDRVGIFFDELDQAYNLFDREKRNEHFRIFLSALFDAVFKFRRTLGANGTRRVVAVCFTRPDIYDQFVEGAAKAQHLDVTARLLPDTENPEAIVRHRAKHAGFPEGRVFDHDQVTLTGISEPISVVIRHRSLGRPRDFVKFYQLAVKYCQRQGDYLSAFDMGKSLMDGELAAAFAEYMQAEFEDLLQVHIPEPGKLLRHLRAANAVRVDRAPLREHIEEFLESERLQIPAERVITILVQCGIYSGQVRLDVHPSLRPTFKK